MSLSPPENDIEQALQVSIREATENAAPLRIVGGDTKAFYGHPVDAEALELGAHSGVIDYDPSELVITLRAGSKLSDVEALLAENRQMLGFEPPHFGKNATVGGMVASGLSGPRRAYAGAIRDFILGVKIIDGRGEVLNFGGRVIKNVAGFDVSRLMVGALGTLGVILEVSLRLIPMVETEVTLGFEHASADEHIGWINELGSRPLPLSASLWRQGHSLLRLSGSDQGVASAVRQLGGDVENDIWPQIREQTHEYFTGQNQFTRIALPATCDDFLPTDQLIEWGGAQRWLRGKVELNELRQTVESRDGMVCAYRGGGQSESVFHPLSAPMLALHRNLKASFDPAAILNPGRFYPEI
ncbi:MAG: glycolate oxidase subunit GlcE [Gammaproteobacteria bacterium]